MSWLFGDLNSIRFMVVLLSFVGWMATARIVRGTVLSLKEREFVEAARALGASDTRIIMRHLVPNSLGPIVVAMTTTVAAAILTEATLSFFGYGVSAAEGKSSWGNLLADADGAITTQRWWLAVFPSLALIITVLAINFVGDGLRDAFDPKQTAEPRLMGETRPGDPRPAGLVPDRRRRGPGGPRRRPRRRPGRARRHRRRIGLRQVGDDARRHGPAAEGREDHRVGQDRRHSS